MSHWNDPFKFLYEVEKEEKEFLEVCGFKWVYEKKEYPHAQDVKIAEYSYDPQEENGLQKIEIFVFSCPAKFLKIEGTLKNKEKIIFQTGSGNIRKYLKKLLPVLELMGNDTLGIYQPKIKEQEKKINALKQYITKENLCDFCYEFLKRELLEDE